MAQRLLMISLLVFVFVAGVEAMLTMRCVLARRQLDVVVEATKLPCLGTSSPAHLDPGIWESVAASYRLPDLLLAQRTAPSVAEVALFVEPRVRAVYAFVAPPVVCAGLAGTAFGGWWLDLRRWRLGAPPNDRLFEPHEARSIRWFHVRAALSAAVLLPALGAMGWLAGRSRDLESGWFLDPLFVESAFVAAAAGAVLVLATVFSLMATRDWKAMCSRAGGRCFDCGYRTSGTERCSECGRPIRERRAWSNRLLIACAAISLMVCAGAFAAGGRAGLGLVFAARAPDQADRAILINFRLGEVLWIRWGDRQCYLCVDRPSPDECCAAFVVFDASRADIDPTQGDVQELKLADGVTPFIAGESTEFDLFVQPMPCGWVRLSGRGISEAIRYPEANCGLAVAHHVWLRAHGIVSPYDPVQPVSQRSPDAGVAGDD